MDHVTLVDIAPAPRQPLSDRILARLFAACIIGAMAAWLGVLVAVMVWLSGAG